MQRRLGFASPAEMRAAWARERAEGGKGTDAIAAVHDMLAMACPSSSDLAAHEDMHPAVVDLRRCCRYFL